MPFKNFEAFQSYLETIVEHFDEGSTINQEANIFIKTDRKALNKVKRSDYDKGNTEIDERVVRYEGRNFHKPAKRVNYFSNCALFLCVRDKIDCDKIPNKEDGINFIAQKTSSKQKMTSRKIHLICENFNILNGYLKGDEI